MLIDIIADSVVANGWHKHHVHMMADRTFSLWFLGWREHDCLLLGNFTGTPAGGPIMSRTCSHAGDVPVDTGWVFERLYHRILSRDFVMGLRDGSVSTAWTRGSPSHPCLGRRQLFALPHSPDPSCILANIFITEKQT